MHPALRRLITAAAVTALPLLGLAVPAAAHEEDAALHWENYEKITLTKNVGEPIDLAVLPDNRVLHTARSGEVRLTDPKTGVTKVVSTIPVYQNSEMGLQTVTLDPGFAENNWVYLYYSPKLNTPAGSAPNTLPAGTDDSYWKQWEGYDVLSRFKWTGESLDLSTEQEIIRIPTNRGQCCHVAGDVDFDAQGNLYLSTGGNTPASGPNVNGYTPINDAPGYNPGLDERRGAGNTNDLRGKILRIHVNEDGSYTIPEGNLFAPGTPLTRPEIFVMGLRNPFRMTVDKATGAVMWGDYGPDAGTADPNRGPMGYVEWQITTKAMNSGWPFCTADNSQPYRDFDFATLTPGPAFDCAAPVNDSRWNTGLRELPPATPATLWYGDKDSDQPWPELTAFRSSTGQAPMGGPVYHYDANNPSPTKFPEYWDGKAFFGEFSQDYVAAFTLSGPDGPVTKLENFLPNAQLSTLGQPIWDNPMDLEFGPDGSLYVLDYGDGFFRQNPDAGLYRIDFAPGDKAPTARMTATPSSGQAPLTVAFDGSASSDPEGGALTYEWDFDGDGTFDATGPQATHTYTENGQVEARLRVTDPAGKHGLTSEQVTTGNTAPTVGLTAPAHGGFFDWGDAIPYAVTVSDPEDGTTPVCSRVAWAFGLGHNQHGHPVNSGTGCTGAVATPTDAGHGETENVFGVLNVTYTDNGAGGVPPATGEAQAVLNPKLMQGEHADETSGVTITDDATASGLRSVTGFDAGDWLAYDPVNFSGITGVQTKAHGAGQLQLRWNAADAAPFATVDVPAGDGWQTVTTPLSGLPSGAGKLFVTSSGGVDVDAFTFQGAGVADKTPPAVSAALTPSAPTGANGWYTGNVTLAVTATDNGTVSSRQYSVDNGVTWANAANPVTLSAEGTTTVLYRATDNGGNVSTPGTLTVKIDKTAPAVTVAGVTEGQAFGDSAALTPVVTATDAASGVAKVQATVDGQPVTPGKPLDLWRLPLGAHQLSVTVTDQAGLTTTKAVNFTTGTSFGDVRALIDRFRDAGWVTKAGAVQLRGTLDLAESHAKAGRIRPAQEALRLFGVLAGQRWNVPDRVASETLRRDATALSGSLKA
ncbi:PQQ-dependent sugar dehydrogenase [Amycolatopsis tucumanensis]|uniref:Lectin n=1 Tax=Amycolatopsis tucumanensis TaxID=401106 RepID=A0ABP7J354_9PSEU|nr:PQQ-dependent sugar dehydrogenase [Amycolatopsis tucumanensis]